jgi:hypothetical protein
MLSKNLFIRVLLAIALLIPNYAPAAEFTATELTSLKNQILELQAKLSQLEEIVDTATSQVAINSNTLKKQKKLEVTATEPKEGIKVGGAVRTNYSYTSYDDGNKNRGGDFDFDMFGLNLKGQIGDVSLNGEIRFYNYMTVIKSAYVGYQLSDNWQVLAGIAKVPFGNSPYNSQNYLFSPNYYLGLEDDHDLGLVLKRSIVDNWQLDLAFFKNDELGGVDGNVNKRSDRYSYDIVGIRPINEGINAAPSKPLGEYNTFSGRVAYHFTAGELHTEVGLSALSGGLHDGASRAGDYQAWAIHANSQYQNWHLQLQQTQYDYNVNQATRIAVGAYSFFDSIAAQATSTTANLAYDMAVHFGPVTALQFYNNYGMVYSKSDGTANTVMNVTGVSIAAGGIFTYLDWVNAKNQPFVGGSSSGNSKEFQQRLNMNIGYYF